MARSRDFHVQLNRFAQILKLLIKVIFGHSFPVYSCSALATPWNSKYGNTMIALLSIQRVCLH